jgi:hypothetical protein
LKKMNSLYLERDVERDLEPEEERERDLELREEDEEELLLPDEERENLPRRFFFLPRGDFCRASSFSYTCGNQPINMVSFLSLSNRPGMTASPIQLSLLI